MRTSFLPFALPDIDNSELQQIKEALDSGWVTTGPKTKQFEAAFAAAVGARHAVAVNSCTAAMHLALEAIGLKAGDEVIVPTYTFAATAEVVRYFDARPVLVDVDPRCLNLDPDRVEAAITPHTRAIIPVHIAGLPAEMDAIADIAARHGLAIVEDAAHAFPTRYKGRLIGSPLPFTGQRSTVNGHHLVCFSFYATKTITTGEGGMLCTDDEALADRCRIMALHGISKDAWKRYTAEGSWYYEIVAPGFKYNMTDIAAGMGLAQLAKAEAMWRRRQEIARRYNAAFAGYPALELPHDRPDCQHAWHLYMLRLRPEHLPGLSDGSPQGAEDGVVRRRFIEELRKRQIGVSVHFIPLHLHPYYRETYGYRPSDFPVAYREYLREVSLPIYSRMSDQDVADVIEAVCDVATTFGG
ncbi:MAG: DegT/DnrJ/EryC1/StrS aminotransferase family protein [Caldilineales bacterium]|nr:DegT/DnrJ/EryC1/StrS aminotransferase family protein [Caldilineales bacterium]